MDQRRILITGGAGLVGSHIADAAVRAGAGEVVIFEQFSRGTPANLAWAAEHGNVRVVEGDIRDRRALADAFAGIDIVFHQAALRVTLCAEEPRLAHEVMVDGTFNVAEAAVAAGVKKVVLASSASVYGMATVFPTPEDHHTYANRTLYGAAKAYNEALLRSYHEMAGLDYVALRYFNVYGPRTAITGPYTEVLIRWMERIETGQAPLIHGDGSAVIDFVYIDDVAQANIAAATSNVTDEVFNVGSGVPTTLAGLALALAEAMGRPGLAPELVPARAVNPVPMRLASVDKARQMLGFEAQVPLREGLSRLVDWWRQERLVQEVAA